MSQPLFYFMRHGETDWNAEGRLQGQRDTPLNAVGCRQATTCGEILRRLLDRDRRDPQTFDYIASPLVRASKTMELVRTELGLAAAGYRTDGRLAEMAFGRWEGLTFAEIKRSPADTQALATREHDRWGFRAPGGESYADVLVRMRQWQEAVAGDTIVVAHGGVARTLIVSFDIESPAAAAVHPIEQGVVYRFAPGRLMRYA
jgi:broad specificity phosphatase PhoE